MAMFKVLIEKDGDKLLFVEGPAELVSKAVNMIFDAEKSKPTEKRSIERFSDQEESLLVRAVLGDGLHGKDLRAALPTRPAASIRSALQRFARENRISSEVADAACKDLC